MKGDADHIWTTDTFDERSKMTRWSDVVSRHMTEMDVGSENPRHFRAVWQQYALGPVRLNFIAAMPQRVRRTPLMVARTGEPSYELVYMRRGSMTIRYQDRQESADAGDFALLRNAEPYDFFCPEESVALTAHVSDRWLRRWLPDADFFGAASRDARKAWGAPLVALLSTLADNGLLGAALPREVIADQLGAMLALLAGPAVQLQTRHRQVLLARLRRLLRDSHDDPDLDPATLARAAGISKRYLHGIFAGAGTSFGRELNELRLQRGESLLRDARYAARHISEIAYMVGFTDPSHFARRFRAHYGASPAAFRDLTR